MTPVFEDICLRLPGTLWMGFEIPPIKFLSLHKNVKTISQKFAGYFPLLDETDSPQEPPAPPRLGALAPIQYFIYFAKTHSLILLTF